MAYRISLRFMKFLVDFLYYALPFITFLLRVAFWAFLAFIAFAVICIIL